MSNVLRLGSLVLQKANRFAHHCWLLPFTTLSVFGPILLNFSLKADQASFQTLFKRTFLHKSAHSSSLEHAM